jgi:hypothetical protein
MVVKPIQVSNNKALAQGNPEESWDLRAIRENPYEILSRASDVGTGSAGILHILKHYVPIDWLTHVR